MNQFKNNKDFQQINPDKQQMIELLAQSLQGRQLTEALPIIMNWKKELAQKGLSFTPDENTLLTSILTQQMTPEQKKQYEVLQAMMHSRKK